MKRVVKMDVKYLEHVITALRLINEGTEEFVQKLAQCSKAEALERWIAGLERTVKEAKK
jgi:hypothetical protein